MCHILYYLFIDMLYDTISDMTNMISVIHSDKDIFITHIVKESFNLVQDGVFENVLELTEEEKNERNTLKLKALTHLLSGT